MKTGPRKSKEEAEVLLPTNSYKGHEKNRVAAIKVQTKFRQYRAYCLAKCRKIVATKLQHWYIKHKTILLFRKCHIALCKMQKHWRARMQKKELDFAYMRNEAAGTFQSCIRGYRQRVVYASKIIACKKIQSIWRGSRARKHVAKKIARIKEEQNFRTEQLKFATVTLQRFVRGYLAKLLFARERQQMIIKVMWCENCKKAEPGGGRCKFCGRKLVMMEKLPHELRSADMLDKTFTHYGFNHCFSRLFSGPTANIASQNMIEVPHPDQTPIKRRSILQHLTEDKDFDASRYEFEFVQGVSSKKLSSFLSHDIRSGFPAISKKRITAILKTSEIRDHFSTGVSLQPWQVLLRPMVVKGNTEHMQLWSIKHAQIQLWVIVQVLCTRSE